MNILATLSTGTHQFDQCTMHTLQILLFSLMIRNRLGRFLPYYLTMGRNKSSIIWRAARTRYILVIDGKNSRQSILICHYNAVRVSVGEKEAGRNGNEKSNAESCIVTVEHRASSVDDNNRQLR